MRENKCLLQKEWVCAMFALLFLALEGDLQNKTPIIAPASLEKKEQAAPNDWGLNVPETKKIEVKNEFDPNAALYTNPSMCVIIKGQPEPECAKVQAKQAIVLNDDLFGVNIGGDESTCQSIETIKKDVSGNPKRVFTTFCGEDPARSDFKERITPSGDDVATRPSLRKIGPNEIGSLSTQ